MFNFKETYENLKDEGRCINCPVKVSVSDKARLHVNAESLMKCCRVHKQIEAAKRVMDKQ